MTILICYTDKRTGGSYLKSVCYGMGVEGAEARVAELNANVTDPNVEKYFVEIDYNHEPNYYYE